MWWIFSGNLSSEGVVGSKGAAASLRDDRLDWTEPTHNVGKVRCGAGGRWPEAGDRVAYYANREWLGNRNGVLVVGPIRVIGISGEGRFARTMSRLKIGADMSLLKRTSVKPILGDEVHSYLVNSFFSADLPNGQRVAPRLATMWPVQGRSGARLAKQFDELTRK